MHRNNNIANNPPPPQPGQQPKSYYDRVVSNTAGGSLSQNQSQNPQLNFYHKQAHVRQPESTLFEDSPDSSHYAGLGGNSRYFYQQQQQARSHIGGGAGSSGHTTTYPRHQHPSAGLDQRNSSRGLHEGDNTRYNNIPHPVSQQHVSSSHRGLSDHHYTGKTAQHHQPLFSFSQAHPTSSNNPQSVRPSSQGVLSHPQSTLAANPLSNRLEQPMASLQPYSPVLLAGKNNFKGVGSAGSTLPGPIRQSAIYPAQQNNYLAHQEESTSGHPQSLDHGPISITNYGVGSGSAEIGPEESRLGGLNKVDAVYRDRIGSSIVQDSDDIEREVATPDPDRLKEQEDLYNLGNSKDSSGVEVVIMNIFSKMKNLEGKYIDLANFYKQELVKTTGSNKKPEDQQVRAQAAHSRSVGATDSQHSPRSLIPDPVRSRPPSSREIDSISAGGPRSQKEEMAGVLHSKHQVEERQDGKHKMSHKSLQQSPLRDNSNRTPTKSAADPYILQSERKIINELIEEKKKLEEDMQQVMSLRMGLYEGIPMSSLPLGELQSPGILRQASPATGGILSDFKTNIPSREQLHFLNQQLSEALSEIVESVDNAQRKATSYIAGKQNDMYQIATNRAYNFPPQLKNEAIGLWYDAKTKVASLMSDLKSAINNKKTQIEANLVSSQINSVRRHGKGEGNLTSGGNTFMDQLNAAASGTHYEFRDINQKVNAAEEFPFSKQLEESLRRELHGLKKKCDHHAKAVQKLRNSFRFKENLIKDEQSKLQSIIKDLLNIGSQQASGLGTIGLQQDSLREQLEKQNSRRNERLTSGERVQSQQVLMSPFQKKIASYQKSAERRKQTGERSGSRSRPPQASNSGSNFYPGGASSTYNMSTSNPHQTIAAPYGQKQQAHTISHDPYLNQQDLTTGALPSDSQELKIIRSKLRHLDNCFDDFTGKLLVRGQDSKDMDRQFDVLFSEISKFNLSVDSVLNQYNSNVTRWQQHHGDGSVSGGFNRNRSKNGRGDQSLNVSPGFHTLSPYAGGTSQSLVSASQKEQEKKMQELLKSNDQIYTELRKATEKYLNQRVENTKLKDEIQMLQSQISGAHAQISRLSNGAQGGIGAAISAGDSTTNALSGQPGAQRQQIRLKSRPSRQEQTQAGVNPLSLSTQSIPGQQAARTLSSNSSHILRENEELRLRVKDLEKECYQMMYYQQEMQRRSGTMGASDPVTRDNIDLRTKIEQLCLQVQQFLLAMRRLQRAVNNKEKDIQDLKADFEKNKKILEQMVKEIKEKEEQKRATHTASNHSLSRISGQNGPSANHSMVVLSSSEQKRQDRFDSKTRQQVSLQPRNRSLANNINHLAGQSYQGPSSQTNSATKGASVTQRHPQTSDQLGNSLDQSSLPPKKGVIRAKHNIQPVLVQAQPVLAPDNPEFNLASQAEGQITEMAKMAEARDEENIKTLLEQIAELEHANSSLTSQKESLDVKCQQFKTSLAQANEKLLKAESKLFQTEQLLKDYSTGLKKEVVLLIAQKEEELEGHLYTLGERLREKEEDLASLKTLFFCKLKELESSFVELNNDLDESEAAQQEASRRLSQQRKEKSNLQSSILSQHQMLQEAVQKDLERSIEQVIGKLDDDDDDQLEQLVALNEQLSEENRELREHVKELEKDLENGNDMELVRQQFQGLHEENQALEKELALMQTQRESDKLALEQQKRLNERQKGDAQDIIRIKDTEIDQLQKQVQEANMKLRESIELLEESERVREEEAGSQAISQSHAPDVERLTAELQSLTKELEVLRGLNELKSQENDHSSVLTGGLDINDDRVELAKIDASPRDQALAYLKQLRSITKEYKILEQAHEKLEYKYGELKESNGELKIEARESAQEVMDLEGQLEALREEQASLISQIERLQESQGSTEDQKRTDEEALRSQIEGLYEQRLARKEQEIEDVNSKLARISQSNIELKTKCDRLDASFQELYVENEGNREKAQKLEMELEMTKETTERDMEQLSETLKSLENEKQSLDNLLTSLRAEKDSLQANHDALLREKKSLSNHNLAIASDQASLQDKINILENDLHTLQEDKGSLQEQLDSIQIECVSLLEQRSLLKGELEALQSTQSDYTQSLQSQLEEAKEKILLMEKQHATDIISIKDFQQSEIAQTKSSLEALEQQQREKEKNFANQTKLAMALYSHFKKLVQSEVEDLIKQQTSLQLERENTTQAFNQLTLTHESQAKAFCLLQEDLDAAKNAISAESAEFQRQKTELKEEISSLKEEHQAFTKAVTERQDQQVQELLSQKDNENAVLSEEIQTLKGLLESLKEKLDSFKDVSSTKEAELQQDISTLEEQLKIVKTTSQESESALLSSITNYQAQCDLLQAQEKTLKDSLDALNTEIINLKQQHEEALKHLQDSHIAEKENLKAQFKAQEDKMKVDNEAKLNKRVKEVEITLQNALEETQRHGQEADRLREELDQMRNELRETLELRDSERTASNKQIEDLNAKHKGEIASIEEQNESIRNQQSQLQQDIELLKDTIESLESKLASSEAEREAALVEFQSQEQTLAQLKLEYQQVQQEHSETLENLNSAHAQEIKSLKEHQAAELEKIKTKSKTTSEEDAQKYEKELKALEEEWQAKFAQAENEAFAKLQKLEGELNIEISEKGDLLSQVAELEALNEQLQERITELEESERQQDDLENEQVRALNAKVDELERSSSHQRAEFENTSHDLEKRLTLKITEADAQGKDLEQAYNDLADKQAELEEARAIVEELRSAFQDKDGECADLKLHIQELKEESSLKQEEVKRQLGSELISRLHEERAQFSNQVEGLESKIEELTELIAGLEGQVRAYRSQQRLLNESLLQDGGQTNSQEAIGLRAIESDGLQFCRRVKYLEKQWFLIFGTASGYTWIDQDNIPVEKLNRIKVEEDLEGQQDLIEAKLQEILIEKEALLKEQQQMSLQGTPRSQSQYSDQQQISEYLQLKTLERENASLRAEILTLKQDSNALRILITQLQSKSSAQQDMILTLAATSSASAGGSLGDLVNQNQDLKRSNMDLAQAYQRAEAEREALQAKIQEIGDLSFAKANGYQSGHHPKNAGSINFDNASSIDQESEIGEDAAAHEKSLLHQKVLTLEDEIVKYKQKIQKMKEESKELLDTSDQQKHHDEDFIHIKSLFIQYISQVPASSKAEQLLPVLFSMLKLTPDEIDKIKRARDALTQQAVKEGVKKGVLGGIFGAKK